jgi:hypothetical protein
MIWATRYEATTWKCEPQALLKYFENAWIPNTCTHNNAMDCSRRNPEALEALFETLQKKSSPPTPFKALLVCINLFDKAPITTRTLQASLVLGILVKNNYL